MKKLLLSCALLAGVALTATGASAEMLNQWLLDQFNASPVQTQAQIQTPTPAQGQAEAVKVKASLVQVPQEMNTEPKAASADLARPATLQPVNSELAPLK